MLEIGVCVVISCTVCSLFCHLVICRLDEFRRSMDRQHKDLVERVDVIQKTTDKTWSAIKRILFDPWGDENE